ncbi:putative bifunctional diguanylate cyclase/phosphodiesterase [Marinilactibacillus piezotolerans]|uniref:putative bifunctional diguanylate cyclase/phosphodiesterase n=1 Tax=Marinilactibacillus piezotolerans TaxID=258723 RepID=UPI0009B0980E|nr:GGDEF and EAL domain-containing protein [Marinilactibacillus piezotolerans]
MSTLSIYLAIPVVNEIVYYSWLVILALSLVSVLFYFRGKLNEKTIELVNISKEKENFESVFDTDTSFVWEMDKDKKSLSASQGVCKVLKYDEKKYPSLLNLWKECIYPEDLPAFLEFVDELEYRKGKPQEFRILDGEGNVMWLETYVNVVNDLDGQILKFVGTAVNVTHRKLEEQKIRENSYYDQLTSLPNRKMFYRHFREQVQLEEKEMSVIVLDIDRFKVINELYGRESGDKVLEMVAEKLQLLLGEQTFIARESEDEFLILLETANEKRTKLIAEKIMSIFKKPLNIDNQLFYLTISMGISLYPETAQDILALYQQAEIAMYKVKETGKNNYHVFMTDDAASIERKRRIEFGLKEALTRNELYLVYQPKVDLSTGKSYATEALIRWKHPLLGEVSPGEFIPIAEESGIISDIGYWVVYEAIRQNKIWHNAGILLQVAVNVSALQYEDPFFVERIRQTLLHHNMEAKYFIIEITESVMQNAEQSNRVIKELHDLGVQVAIDDFGTGYSSLSVLNNVFIDIVKIDKSFIDGIMTKVNTASLVKTMIQMGKSLKFHIVAEGIETEGQAEFLKENDCSYGQGYLFSKPLRPEEIPAKIA